MRETTGSNIAYPPVRGTGSILANEASSVVTHSLGVTPDIVIPIPTNPSAVAAGLHVTAKTSTAFTIEAVTPQVMDMTFDYEVGKT